LKILKAKAKRERWARNLVYSMDTKAANFVWFLRHPVVFLKCLELIQHKPGIRL
jgi:hypothetical protein